MRGGEAGAESASDLQRLVGRKPANAAQQRRKVLAIDIFHRKEKMTFDLADIVNAADVRMRHLTRKPDLITKALNRRGILTEGLGKKLERDWLAQREVVGAIHLSHSAFAEKGNDAIPAG
jgi:hypothetical protein